VNRIPASKILSFDPSDFVNRLKSPVTLVYDDGVVVTHTAHELAVNRYIYSILELVPDLGIKSTYSIHNYYVGGQYVKSSINNSFEAILSDVVAIYVPSTGSRKCLEPVYEKMFLILEAIYNNIVCGHLEYVSTLSIKDFLDIQMKPELLEAIDAVRVKRDLESVNNTYDVLDKVIRTYPDLSDNPIAKGYISGTISSNQVKQLLGSRGFVTEIDSSIFKYPIASSFVLGMDNMYDIAVESRSGAKALYLSNRAISLSEYFAREMQLATMAIQPLVDGDCGNRDVIDWVVKEKDFKNLLGAHYFVDGQERIIGKDSKDIIGTNIKIRNAMRCKLGNKRHICTACFGEISNNIPMHANLGHITLTILTAVVSQLILSTKHITTSASSDSIVLTPAMRAIFIIKNKDSYAFRANTINKKKVKYRLHIPQEQGFGLTDISNSSDVYKLNLARVSRLNVVYLSIEDANGTTEMPMPVKQGNRYGNLTYNFLEYIKQHGYSLDRNDRFVIELDEWKTGVPVIVLPQVEFSYIDLAKAIKNEFKSMKDDASNTPEALLHRIFELVNSKLNINIALLQVIIYAFTVEDPSNNKFGLARGSNIAGPTKLGNIMTMRSVGGAYAWEFVLRTLLKPTSYYGYNSVDHPLDVLLKPSEVLAAEQ